MFDHVTIRVDDREASERFYATVLPTLGKQRTSDSPGFLEWGDFSISTDGPLTRGLHIAFFAADEEQVHAFFRAGVEAGYVDDGEPGPRPEYMPDYYGAFLLDPDGNSVEAVHHGQERDPGAIDHLWLRTRDVKAIARFYATIAPHVGVEVHEHSADHVQIKGERGSFSYVTGDTPTEHVHLAFDAPDNKTVAAFHKAATDAGYRNNGGPGERTIYHPGYYGAFVLDPDGHNIEAVNHNR